MSVLRLVFSTAFSGICGVSNIILNWMIVKLVLGRIKMKDNIIIKKLSIMETGEIKQVAHILYNWWGKDCNLTINDIEEVVKNRCSEKTIPITYIAKINDMVVGTICFLDNDTQFRKDLYPMIGGLFVKEKYRHQNIATMLLNILLNEVSKNFNQVFLTTPLDNFYECFGFEFIEITDVNMVNGKLIREKLYRKEFR